MRTRFLMIGLCALTLTVPVASSASRAPLHDLCAGGPAPELRETLKLFGQFVGDWDVESIIYQPDGTRQMNSGEWHFGWILGGRAIQDVFVLREAANRDKFRSFGTTVRVPDLKDGSWHVVYASVTTGSLQTFLGRQVGDEIVMETRDQGPLSRWIFSQVTPTSFHWRSVESSDGGTHWVPNQEMIGHRRR